MRGDHTKRPEWSACAGAYQMLPNITRAVIWLYPVRENTLPTGPPPMVIDDMQEYNEVSEQGGPGCSLWHTVGVVGIIKSNRHHGGGGTQIRKENLPGAQASKQNDKK